MQDLPGLQVNLVRLFLHTGIDYTSYIWIKGFTCRSHRAVHIELVPDMNASSFSQAFIPFTNVNGVHSHLYSDNARMFIAAATIINKGMVKDEFKEKIWPLLPKTLYHTPVFSVV